MKVLSKIMTKTGFEQYEVPQDLGIVIIHNGKEFYLNVDNFDRLYLTSKDSQLIIQPRSSNNCVITSEN